MKYKTKLFFVAVIVLALIVLGPPLLLSKASYLRYRVWSAGNLVGVYNSASLRTLSHTLSPEDVPGLIELYATAQRPTGVMFGLISQCQAGLDGVMNSVADGTFHGHLGTEPDLSMATEIVGDIAGYAVCDSSTRSNANVFLARLDALKKVKHTAAIIRSQREQAQEKARVVQGIEDLKSYTKGTLHSLPRPVSP